jgi:hypothetical protein
MEQLLQSHLLAAFRQQSSHRNIMTTSAVAGIPGVDTDIEFFFYRMPRVGIMVEGVIEIGSPKFK